jgi:pyrimidine operon attenuation protein/uracil phosphoribosyltransferase
MIFIANQAPQPRFEWLLSYALPARAERAETGQESACEHVPRTIATQSDSRRRLGLRRVACPPPLLESDRRFLLKSGALSPTLSGRRAEQDSMNPQERRLCDAQQIDELVTSMTRQIVDEGLPDVPLYFIGIRSRGVPLAERLATKLRQFVGRQVEVGAVDITLYRDDLGQAHTWPVLLGTEIPFDIENAEVVLVDDVLFTGRTVRAALNAVCDLGRPARIALAALVDRGHRELPIQPDVVGLYVSTDRSDHVRVRLHPVDPVEEIVRFSGGDERIPSERSPVP